MVVTDRKGVREHVLALQSSARDWLIVTGDARGTMWYNGRTDDADLTPVIFDGEPATFERWYLHWLDEAEAAVTETE